MYLFKLFLILFKLFLFKLILFKLILFKLILIYKKYIIYYIIKMAHSFKNYSAKPAFGSNKEPNNAGDYILKKKAKGLTFALIGFV